MLFRVLCIAEGWRGFAALVNPPPPSSAPSPVGSGATAEEYLTTQEADAGAGQTCMSMPMAWASSCLYPVCIVPRTRNWVSMQNSTSSSAAMADCCLMSRAVLLCSTKRVLLSPPAPRKSAATLAVVDAELKPWTYGGTMVVGIN